MLNARGEWYEKPGGRRDPRYRFDNTTTMADPGSGDIRFNSATIASISQIAISTADRDGITMTQVLERLTHGSRITVEEVATVDTITTFEVIGNVDSFSGWYRINVRAIQTVGVALPTNAERVNVWFDYANLPGGWPGRTVNGSATIARGDLDSRLQANSGGPFTWTIPSNSSQAWPVGSMVELVNRSGGNITVAITTDTLRNIRTGATGSQTIPDNKNAVIEKVAATEWWIAIAP